MCRKKGKKYYPVCKKFNKDPKKWDKDCVLSPRKFDKYIRKFQKAVFHFMNGDRKKCLALLKEIPNKKIQDWAIEHAQVAGHTRLNHYKINKPEKNPNTKLDVKLTPKISNKIFELDNYHCRYCGLELISRDFFKQFAKALNAPKVFSYGRTNESKHGLILIALPFADHVKPYSQGGKTNRTNLVASCGSCNFGKQGSTLKQLKISNPLKRSAKKSTWDGFSSITPALKR